MLNDENIYERIIALVKSRDWSSYEATMPVLLKQIQAHPSSAVAFASLVMETYPRGGTFFDTALSFLPLNDWPIVIDHAMKILRADPANRAAQCILEYANLQCPANLQVYAEEITTIAFLSDDLLFVAFDDSPSLYPPRARHLAFSAPYLAELVEKRSAKAEDRCHPTWVQNAEYFPCPVCNTPSSFLMQLDDGLLVCDEIAGEHWCWDWSGGGMGYILWCNRCKVSSIFEQCT